MNSIDPDGIRKRRPTRLWAALMTLGLTALLAVACNGGGDGDGSPTAQPTGGTTVQPTGQATTSAACQALASLESYRYVSNTTLESPEELVPPSEGQPTPAATLTREFTGPFQFEYDIDAALIMPDRVDASITTGGGEPFNLITIGDKNWMTVGGQWQEVTAQYVVPYKPLDICTAIFPELNLDQAKGEKETVNDIPALHYAFPAVPSGQAWATIFGPDSDMDVLFQTMDVELWVAEKDGWPVKMDIQTSGLYSDWRQLKGHIQIELRDINADDIKVEPPI